jgi:Family of unknown function (DUF6174)
MRWSMLLLCALVTWSCGGATGLSERESNQALWKVKGPNSYSYLFGEMTADMSITLAKVTVVNSTVVAALNVDVNGKVVGPRSSLNGLPTIEDLFRVVERYESDKSLESSLLYDLNFGYPRQILFHPSGQSRIIPVVYQTAQFFEVL